MTAKMFNSKLFALPTTQMILGTMVKEKPSFMALAWATRVNFKPPLVAISVNKGHMSHEALRATGQFSLCMPGVDMVPVTDYVGLVSARNTDKSGLFDVFHGELENAPMIRSCPLNLALEVYTSVDLPTNTVFIGEIKEAWCDEECLEDGVPDMTKIQPFFLSMPDNRYWGLGQKVGDAWKDGKVLIKKS